MKPSWKIAPDWANYLAMDSTYVWYWYENEPTYNHCTGCWDSDGKRHLIISSKDYDQLAKDTLENRPIYRKLKN